MLEVGTTFQTLLSSFCLLYMRQRNHKILATPDDEMAGTMSFASLTDAVAVAMVQWREQHCSFIVEAFF
jgi:hypothetical protein